MVLVWTGQRQTTTLSGDLWPPAFVTVHPPPTQQEPRSQDDGVGFGKWTWSGVSATALLWQKLCPDQERRRHNATPGKVHKSQAHWAWNNSNTGNSYHYFIELCEQKQSFLSHIFLMTNCINLYLSHQSRKQLDGYDRWSGKDKGLRKAKNSKHMSESVMMRIAAYLTDPWVALFLSNNIICH